jgi:putative transcriptional regulator
MKSLASLITAIFFAFGVGTISGTVNAEERPRNPATPWLAGQLLIASPDMRDPRFSKTIIYMVQHDREGALGIVVNKQIGEGKISELLKGLGRRTKDAKGQIRLHLGGPVQPDRAFVLHSGDYQRPDSRTIKGGISFTTNMDILDDLGAGKGPRHILFALGYAGWGAGQLDNEIEHGSWTVAAANDEIVFKSGAKGSEAWEKIRKASGLPL